MTQSLIISFPQFLIINFQIIGENKCYSHKVDFQLDLIINENEKYEIKYKLIGYLKYIGRGKSGHNEAISKNFFDIFGIYNDNVITYLNNNKNIINKSNDILLFFYKKEELQISENTKEIL